jgi:hypothetical protein
LPKEFCAVGSLRFGRRAHRVSANPEIGFAGVECLRENRSVFGFDGAAVARSLYFEGAHKFFGKIADCEMSHCAYFSEGLST